MILGIEKAAAALLGWDKEAQAARFITSAITRAMRPGAAKQMEMLPALLARAGRLGIQHPVVDVLGQVSRGLVRNTPRVENILNTGMPQLNDLIRRALTSVRNGQFVHFLGNQL